MRPWRGGSQHPLFASLLGAAGKMASDAVGPKIDWAASCLFPRGLILLSHSRAANWKRLLLSSYHLTAQVSQCAVTHLLHVTWVQLAREPPGGALLSRISFSWSGSVNLCGASQASFN